MTDATDALARALEDADFGKNDAGYFNPVPPENIARLLAALADEGYAVVPADWARKASAALGRFDFEQAAEAADREAAGVAGRNLGDGRSSGVTPSAAAEPRTAIERLHDWIDDHSQSADEQVAGFDAMDAALAEAAALDPEALAAALAKHHVRFDDVPEGYYFIVNVDDIGSIAAAYAAAKEVAG